MIINEKIKQYLEDHGITQKFISVKSGLPHWRLSKILSCKRKITAEELGKIANALKVDPNIFLV